MAESEKNTRKPTANGLKRLEEKLSLDDSPMSFPDYVRSDFDSLARIVKAAGRRADKWDKLAEWAFEEGVTGGKPLTGAAVRKAFYREVARRKKLEEAAAAKRKERSQPAPIGAPVRTADPPPPTLPSVADVPPASPRKRLELKPVTIRKQP
ncbi:MAG: hypothetical protein ACJ8AW_52240 [Rhodopila sp.]